MKNSWIIVLILLGTTNVSAEIVTKEIDYKAGDTVMKGYIAYSDETDKKRPGILVVHEWWGHNEYARQRARMLAELGYTALAVDMYGDGKQAHHPQDAGKFSSEVKSNMPEAKKRFYAAMSLLQKHKTTNSNQISAIGYCFGGGIVLEMARLGLGLDSVVSFHGSLGTSNPAKPGAVKAKILVLNGAADPFVKPEQIETFKNEMKNAKVHYEFISYPEAKHAFTNPGADKYGQQFNIPLAYNKTADEKSWNEMLELFKSVYAP